EIRHIFTKHGGNLGENGCVAWMFAKKGSIVIDKKVIDEDALMELVLEAGAEDVKTEDSEYEVITDPGSFEAVKKILDDKGIKHLEARIGMIPSNTVKLEANKAEQMLKMMEKLEDNDDVQNVYSNFDIDEEVMKKLS
ncbi:MAG TPA: YebC/PmpR family DNA-binding transcriptional regulator, partial [Smithella sp.]|nr:YebC/PmpR family DNA-binding transcriptional regulator [Smithella sp.]